jgi:hypothetical protein
MERLSRAPVAFCVVVAKLRFLEKRIEERLVCTSSQYRVFLGVNTWTLACFLFFAVLPLPVAYSPSSSHGISVQGRLEARLL